MSIKYFAIFGVTVAAALAWAPLTIPANAHGGGFKCTPAISESTSSISDTVRETEISISGGLTQGTEAFMPFHPMTTAM